LASLVPAILSTHTALTPRTAAVRPLLAMEAGARADTRPFMQSEPPQVQGAAPEQDSGGQSGPGSRPGARHREQPAATPESGDEPVTIAFSPEFLAQALAQLDAGEHPLEAFDEAARAYRRTQPDAVTNMLLETSEHIDFDA
jgi:hypothetical protein